MYLQIYMYIRTELFSSSLKRCSMDWSFFGRIRMKIVVTRGHERSSFSRRAFPKKPVAPVKRITVSAKNASIEPSFAWTLSCECPELVCAFVVLILMSVLSSTQLWTFILTLGIRLAKRFIAITYFKSIKMSNKMFPFETC